jgi:hypothetical protein
MRLFFRFLLLATLCSCVSAAYQFWLDISTVDGASPPFSTALTSRSLTLPVYKAVNLLARVYDDETEDEADSYLLTSALAATGFVPSLIVSNSTLGGRSADSAGAFYLDADVELAFEAEFNAALSAWVLPAFTGETQDTLTLTLTGLPTGAVAGALLPGESAFGTIRTTTFVITVAFWYSLDTDGHLGTVLSPGTPAAASAAAYMYAADFVPAALVPICDPCVPKVCIFLLPPSETGEVGNFVGSLVLATASGGDPERLTWMMDLSRSQQLVDAGVSASATITDASSICYGLTLTQCKTLRILDAAFVGDGSGIMFATTFGVIAARADILEASYLTSPSLHAVAYVPITGTTNDTLDSRDALAATDSLTVVTNVHCPSGGAVRDNTVLMLLDFEDTQTAVLGELSFHFKALDDSGAYVYFDSFTDWHLYSQSTTATLTWDAFEFATISSASLMSGTSVGNQSIVDVALLPDSAALFRAVFLATDSSASSVTRLFAYYQEQNAFHVIAVFQDPVTSPTVDPPHTLVAAPSGVDLYVLSDTAVYHIFAAGGSADTLLALPADAPLHSYGFSAEYPRAGRGGVGNAVVRTADKNASFVIRAGHPFQAGVMPAPSTPCDSVGDCNDWNASRITTDILYASSADTTVFRLSLRVPPLVASSGDDRLPSDTGNAAFWPAGLLANDTDLADVVDTLSREILDLQDGIDLAPSAFGLPAAPASLLTLTDPTDAVFGFTSDELLARASLAAVGCVFAPLNPSQLLGRSYLDVAPATLSLALFRLGRDSSGSYGGGLNGTASEGACGVLFSAVTAPGGYVLSFPSDPRGVSDSRTFLPVLGAGVAPGLEADVAYSMVTRVQTQTLPLVADVFSGSGAVFDAANLYSGLLLTDPSSHGGVGRALAAQLTVTLDAAGLSPEDLGRIGNPVTLSLSVAGVDGPTASQLSLAAFTPCDVGRTVVLPVGAVLVTAVDSDAAATGVLLAPIASEAARSALLSVTAAPSLATPTYAATCDFPTWALFDGRPHRLPGCLGVQVATFSAVAGDGRQSLSITASAPAADVTAFTDSDVDLTNHVGSLIFVNSHPSEASDPATNLACAGLIEAATSRDDSGTTTAVVLPLAGLCSDFAGALPTAPSSFYIAQLASTGLDELDPNVATLPALLPDMRFDSPPCALPLGLTVATLIDDTDATTQRFLDVGSTLTLSVSGALIARSVASAASSDIVGAAFAALAPAAYNFDVTVTRPDLSSLRVSPSPSTASTVAALSDAGVAGALAVVLRAAHPTSLRCPASRDVLDVFIGCPPSKTLSFYTGLTTEEFLYDDPTDEDGIAMVEPLSANYRPPSALGKMLPTSTNLYAADPAITTRYTHATVDAAYKQCLNRNSRADCGCTDEQRASNFVADSDCIDHALRVYYSSTFSPTFIISSASSETSELTASYTLFELNGRTDYCPSSAADCSDPTALAAAVITPSTDSISFSGEGLFHFHVTAHVDSYCSLTTEFKIWVYEAPVQSVVEWSIISITALTFALILFAGYLMHYRIAGPRF